MMDLLDILDAQDTPVHVHALMPSMATACGLSALEVMARSEAVGRSLLVMGSKGLLSPEAGGRDVLPDCPECIRVGDAHGGLAALCRAMQERQAAGK